MAAVKRIKRRTTQLHLLPPAWRFLVGAIVFTAVIPLIIHTRLSNSEVSNNTLLFPLPRKEKDNYNHKLSSIIQAANQAEQEVLDFFHGESRALQDGVPHEKLSFLTERLAHRIAECHYNNENKNCTLKIVFIGSGQTTGRDNFFNSTYPFGTQQRLQSIVQAAGLELEVYNHAFDSDLSREGPQKFHMCIQNLVGDKVDVIAWDLDGNLQAKPPAQVEAFVRWAWFQQTALIILQRDGPHGLSRRGTKQVVVNLGPGHDATVYRDDPNNIPPPREEESYRESKNFRQKWQNGRNNFWETVLSKYSGVVDLATVDPEGAIFHLDHLLEFSNMEFDKGKVLPLIDCGKAHPPPCDQVPDFVVRHLARDNMTLANIMPEDDVGGAFCLSMLGCRHVWYGGKKSHALRAELNALPILRAFRDAAKMLQDDNNKIRIAKQEENQRNPQRSFVSMGALPEPEFCSPTFCTLAPHCMTSYVPNLGADLGDAIVTMENEIRPRKGATHFVDNPTNQIHNLDVRFAPLGYIDRKYAYRLSKNNDDGDKKKEKDAEDLDASSTTITFSMAGEGPLVLCEPPCFIDECSKHRMRPFGDYVTLELDDQTLDTTKLPQQAIEVGGPFCKVISASVPEGDHNLRISTSVVSPEHVMISHLISFF